MNKIINCDDIQSILNEFILDVNTLLSWKHTCKKNMKKKYFVIFKNVSKEQLINKDKNIFKKIYDRPFIHDIFNIIQIQKLPRYFDDSYLINFKYLMHLNCINLNKITDESVKYLINISLLQCNDLITDNSISKLTNLLILDLGNNKLITDNSLQYLTKLTKLIINDVVDQISDKSISKLTNLVNLYLGYNRVCNITNISINKLTNLNYLNITGNQYIDNINLPSLRYFYPNTKLKDSQVNCNNLTHLDCDENEYFTDELLFKLSKLESLNCGYNNNFTNKSLIYLSKTLKYLDCGFNLKFDDDGLSSLSILQTLKCSYNFNFTNKSLSYLFNLKFLNCGKNNNFTAIGILKLINLEELICTYGRSNIDIIDLKPLHKLKRINGILFHKF